MGCDALGCDACGPTPPVYTGLTGEWLGLRPALAEQGVTFDADATLFYAGVARGGADQEFRFAGHNDYVAKFDMGKLGVQEGLFLQLRGEHRYGETLSGATGALLPSYVNADLPTLESEKVYLTNVLFTQMLSEQFGFFFGKLDTLDGDLNAFAHGRGKTQFSNVGFVATPIGLRTIPYSTLGAGLIVLGDEGTPLFTLSALNPTELTRVTGLDEVFSEGVTINSELRLPVEILGKRGHQLIGGTWSSRNYVSLDQDPRIILPDIPVARESGSWSLYWNCDQYLVTDATDPSKGWGLFARAGLADAAANPLNWFLSCGLGGNSPIRGRQDDQFGLGWYYSGTSNQIAPELANVLGPIGDGQGIEMFYNVHVTESLEITPDFQIISSSRQVIDTAYVFGIRARMIF